VPVRPTHQETPHQGLFLPDFCAIRVVFSVVVIGELLAFLLVLTPVSVPGDRWRDLGLVSLFIQWVALTSTAILCVSRRPLERLGNIGAGVVSYALVLAVTVCLSEAAYWLLERRLVLHTEPATSPESGYWFSQRGVELAASHLEFLLRNLAIAAIVAAVALRYFYVQYQWRANLESQAQARIQALQSRIRPHFLFNSMNTIASFTRSRPELAEQVVEDLADLFRVSLGDARVPVILARELKICRQYLRIEALRLGDRLRTEWAIDSVPQDALLPALSLQPLVENAIYHGVEPTPEGGAVRVSGRRAGELLEIEVSNTLAPGAGADPREGNRMAQDNVRQRLVAFFGPQARLTVERGETRYSVRLSFPYRKGPAA